MLTPVERTSMGLMRAEWESFSPENCRKNIEDSGCVVKKYAGSRVVRYVIDFDKEEIDVRVMPNKTVMLAESDIAIVGFFKTIQGEDIGRGWVL